MLAFLPPKPCLFYLAFSPSKTSNALPPCSSNLFMFYTKNTTTFVSWRFITYCKFFSYEECCFLLPVKTRNICVSKNHEHVV